MNANWHHRWNPKPRLCNTCGVSYFYSESRHRWCKACYDNRITYQQFLETEATLEHFARKNRELGVHRSWWFSEVRSLCRRWNAHRPKTCQVCGYDKHVEYCHLRPISDFPLDTKLCVVNAESNVAILCRNHHYELDHGLMTAGDCAKIVFSPRGE